MLQRIFPRALDNVWRGHPAGYWLLVPLLLLKAVIGFNSMVFPWRIAVTADDIPLAAYPPDAARAAVSLFAAGGFSLLLLAAFGALALLRYRAMIPLVYLLLLIDQLGSRLVFQAYPIARSAGSAAGVDINLGMLAAMVVGLALSFVGGGRAARPAAAAG